MKIFLKTAIISHNQALEIARTTFRERYAERHISEEVAQRLSFGSCREGDKWLVEVRFLPHAPGREGLETDLWYAPSELLLTISVDAVTGQASLAEARTLPW